MVIVGAHEGQIFSRKQIYDSEVHIFSLLERFQDSFGNLVSTTNIDAKVHGDLFEFNKGW